MACSPTISYNDAQFRTMFPAFANQTTFPQETIQIYWDMATTFVSNLANYGWLTGGTSPSGNPTGRALALNLMTAHIAQIFVLVGLGQTPAPITAAGIDKVNVTLMPPPAKDGWSYWLSCTPYGLQLWALLGVNSVGGWFVGGSPTRSGFNGNSGPYGVC
jgi:hypothetical protein